MPGKARVSGPDVIAYAEKHGITAAQLASAGADGRTITLEDVKALRPMPYVTPVVATLAERHGVDLRDIEGTGVGGRIRKDDVLNAAGVVPAQPLRVPEGATDSQRQSLEWARDNMGPDVANNLAACMSLEARSTPPRTGSPSAWARNPLVDRVRAQAAAARASAPSAPAPSLFAAGDVPSFTASGIPPTSVLQVPWQARHALAAAPTTADAYAIVAECSRDDAVETAQMLYGSHDGNVDYAERVNRWQVEAMSDEQLYDSVFPGAKDERARREGALSLTLPANEEAMIQDYARKNFGV